MQNTRQPSTSHKPLCVVPQLYLSSDAAGWEGLRAQAFHEPASLEGWITPGTSDITLILFAGGPLHLEQRYAQRPWKAQYMRQGDLLLGSGRNIAHESRWQELSPAPTRTLHLQLSRELLAHTAEEAGDYDLTRHALLDRSGFQDPLLAQLGFALWHELEQASPISKLYAQSAAQILAVHLLRHYSTLPETAIRDLSQGLTPRQIRHMRDYVLNHLDQDLSLEALAEQTGYSPYHFARLFRQTTGESPHHFVLQLRIERAQQLLQGRNASLVDIAHALGFANQSHFTRVFKRQLGITPGVYRQNRGYSAEI